jgi:hypothetical protein
LRDVSLRRRFSVTGISGSAITSDRRDGSIGRDLPDPAVARVCHIDIAGGIYYQLARAAELRGATGPVREPRASITGQGGNDEFRWNLGQA